MNALDKLSRIVQIAEDLAASIIHDGRLSDDEEEVLVAQLDDAQVTMEALDDMLFGSDEYEPEDE